MALMPLLSHPDKDLVFSEGQHCAAARSLHVHDHAGVILQPQIAGARRVQTGLAGALRVSARKIGNAGEFVDGAGSGDFVNSAARARNSAEHFEWIAPPLVLEGTAATA